MKEDFLHHVWKFLKFNTSSLETTDGQSLSVVQVGQHNLNSGSDFFNGQVRIDDQLWAGNIEIHIKSSDWYAHHHEEDEAYDNVVLHVVWEHDVAVFTKDGNALPTLVLKGRVMKQTLDAYNQLFGSKKQWINCESNFGTVDDFTISNWIERLFIERIASKNELLLELLSKSKNDWEALLFVLLCKNFGLKVNGASFLSIGQSVDFSVTRKCAASQTAMEALIFGQAGLLEKPNEDGYFLELKKEYDFLKAKFQLDNAPIIAPKFFRLRPPNFPTIRLSQLACLYAARKELFTVVISASTLEEYYAIFNVSASTYWDTHYNFGLTSAKRKKKLTKAFIHLLLINTVLPLKYAYATYQGKDISETLFELALSIPAESNTIIEKFNSFKKVATTALDSQGLLQLKSAYCDKQRCFHCAIGNSLLGK